MGTQHKDYYEILEVHRKASQEVIEKAYKTLARKYHPDVNREKEAYYTSKMQELNEAYEVLSNYASRKQYNAIYDEPIEPQYTDQSTTQNTYNAEKKTENENSSRTDQPAQNQNRSQNGKVAVETPNRVFDVFAYIIVAAIVIIIIVAVSKNISFQNDQVLGSTQTRHGLEQISSLSLEPTPEQTSSISPEPTLEQVPSPIPDAKPIKIESKTTFTVGSTKEDVKRIMGNPDTVSPYNFWMYGLSTINFDENDLVEGWSNIQNTLKVK